MHPTSLPRRAPPLGLGSRDRVQGRGQDEASPLPRPQPSYDDTQACPAVLPAWGPPYPSGDEETLCKCNDDGKPMHWTGAVLPWGHAGGDEECSPPPSPPPLPPPKTRPSPPPAPPCACSICPPDDVYRICPDTTSSINFDCSHPACERCGDKTFGRGEVRA